MADVIRVYLEPDWRKRLALHRTLEGFTASMHVPGKPSRSRRFYKCSGCGGMHPLTREHYSLGFAENNIDESYSWWCGEDLIVWEPNFDDYDHIVTFQTNNAVCSGEYFRGYMPHYTGDAKPLATLLDCLIVPAPTNSLTCGKLGKCIGNFIDH